MRIVCLDGHTLNPGDISWAPVEALGELIVHERTPVDAIVERAQDAEVILTNKCPLSAETIAALPKLRYIGVLATGFNIIDVEAAAARDIPVCNVPEYSTDPVAELVFALMLNFARNPQRHSDAVHQGAWVDSEDFCFWHTPQTELLGKTIGIVGFGRIGQRIGAIAHAFGMRVLAVSRSQQQTAPYPFTWVSAEDAFAQSDFVSLSCPQTAENTGMVNRELLARMQAHAFFINTARGGLVNEADLAQALRDGVIAGAAVDVISKEPMTSDNPLRGAPNLTITPHIAWTTHAARTRLMHMTADNLAAFQNGSPQNVVNQAKTA